MSNSYTPNQNRYDDPYQQRIYDYNTTDSRLYLSRAANFLLKSIGNNIVLDKLNILAVTQVEDEGVITVSANISAGYVIQDSTLLELGEGTLDLDVTSLGDTVHNSAHLVVLVDYKFIETIEPNVARVKLLWVSSTGSVLPAIDYDPTRCLVLLGVISFDKSDPSYIYVEDPVTISPITIGTSGMSVWGPLSNSDFVDLVRRIAGTGTSGTGGVERFVQLLDVPNSYLHQENKFVKVGTAGTSLVFDNTGTLPAAGTSGQVLSKIDDTDYNVHWSNVYGIPTSGTSGQVLTKDSDIDYEVSWQDSPSGLPTGGTSGQMLAKIDEHNYHVDWYDVPNSLPTGGTSGQILTKIDDTNYNTEWDDAPISLPTGGTAGQILAKIDEHNYHVEWIDQHVEPAGVLQDELHIVTSGEVASRLITVPFEYPMGTNQLQVYLNGQLKRINELIGEHSYGDYFEIDTTTIQFKEDSLIEGDQVRFVLIIGGTSGGGTSGVFSSDVHIISAVGHDSILHIWSDHGDDTTDRWSIISVASDNTLRFRNNEVSKIDITTSGQVNVGSETTSGSAGNCSVVFTRQITEDSVSGRATRDEQTYTATVAGKSYCSYDSAPVMEGSLDYDHHISFQARPVFNGSGLLDRIIGFSSIMAASNTGGGHITNVFHYRVKTGISGGADNQYGLYVPELTGATNNYAVCTEGATPSYFGGDVSFNNLVQRSAYNTVNITASTSITITLNIPSGASLKGCSFRVSDDLAVGDLWDAAFSGGSSYSLASNIAVAKNTKHNQLVTPIIAADVTNVVITKHGGGTFTAQGSIDCLCFYDELVSMTDV
jgi:hypothetical protein